MYVMGVTRRGGLECRCSAFSSVDSLAINFAALCLWRRAFRPFRQLVFRVEPRRAIRPPDGHFGSIGERCVQAAHRKQDGVLALARGDDMRAALDAEIPRLAGRGFKTLEQAFTPDPAKAVAGDVGDGGKGRSMRLAAGAAVAMNDRSGFGVDFVRHASAQAVSSKHGISLSNKNPARGYHPRAGFSNA